MIRRLTIGSRGSKLALWQTHHVAELIRRVQPGIEIAVEVISTTGDRILDSPLSKIGGKGVFTKEIEEAQLDGRVDMAVHSLKDLPTEHPEGLVIAAIPSRATPNDVLVSRKHKTLRELPPGTRVGTSSLRRRAQILAANPGLHIVDIRGSVETRIGRIAEGKVDAVVLAAAGIERLDIHRDIAEIIPIEVVLPACGQGALAVQIREGEQELRTLLERIHDLRAAAETAAERAFLAALGGGCQVPIGGLARIEGDALSFRGCVCTLDGSQVLRTARSGSANRAIAIGEAAAEEVIAGGAEEIIAAITIGGAPPPAAP